MNNSAPAASSLSQRVLTTLLLTAICPSLILGMSLHVAAQPNLISQNSHSSAAITDAAVAIAAAPIDNLLTASLPVVSSNTGVGNNFTWAQGLIFNRTYATGSVLITKTQRVFGEEFLLDEAVTENHTTNTTSVNTGLISSTGITLGSQIKTSNGSMMGIGVNYSPLLDLLANESLMADGTLTSDGTLMGDGTKGQSVLANGDETTCMKP